MYLYENNESIYFTFMIDSGYQQVNNDAIRNRWEKRIVFWTNMNMRNQIVK